MSLERFRPLTAEEKDRIRQEILDSCDLVADCWVYRTRNSTGYGVKRIQGKVVAVSRFMLAYSTRESMSIKADACHDTSVCPYRACCNPRHLFWGTHAANAKQREKDKADTRHDGAMLPPIPLGHETHEEHAVWLASLRTEDPVRWQRTWPEGNVDGTLQHLPASPQLPLAA